MENDWKRIIMLDVDGVVNSEDWYGKTKGRSGDFDPEAIKLLNQLKDVGAEVVISSSWGDSAIKPLQDVGLELPIIGFTDHYYQDWVCRGNEIEKWFHDNFGSYGTKYGSKYYQKDYEYVIFDDDADMLLGQADNFIQIKRQTGITQEDINKAIKILNRENNDY
jgi:histidinol phosphatase-like enzyme